VDVAEEVKQSISQVLINLSEQLDNDTKLADLGAESMDILEIIYALEEKFDIDISITFHKTDQSSMSAFATVGDICQVVRVLVDKKYAK